MLEESSREGQKLVRWRRRTRVCHQESSMVEAQKEGYFGTWYHGAGLEQGISGGW